MQLVILRHAEAEPGADNNPDRLLTSVGRQQADAMARQLDQLLGSFRVISSPWVRAAATAAILRAGAPHDLASVALQPSAAVPDAAAVLEPLFDAESALVIVTHQPLCGRLIHWLTDGHDQPLAVAPCSGALLELDWPAAGMARLVRWLAPESL